MGLGPPVCTDCWKIMRLYKPGTHPGQRLGGWACSCGRTTRSMPNLFDLSVEAIDIVLANSGLICTGLWDGMTDDGSATEDS